MAGLELYSGSGKVTVCSRPMWSRKQERISVSIGLCSLPRIGMLQTKFNLGRETSESFECFRGVLAIEVVKKCQVFDVVLLFT